MNIQLIIAYDGTHFLGWQKTSDGPTIEGTLQQVLEQIYQEPLLLQAASRTDRGVHATGQVVSYRTKKERDLKKIQFSLNQMLPPTIRIRAIKEVADDFHPTLDAIEKEYHYFVTTSLIQSPFDRCFAWHCYYPFDLEKMKQAASSLLGTCNFSAFCNVSVSQSQEKVCTIKALDIIQQEERLKMIIKGNRFLYKMARNLVGYLIDIGRGKIQNDQTLLKKQDRKLSGITAPAHGLILKYVNYGDPQN